MEALMRKLALSVAAAAALLTAAAAPAMAQFGPYAGPGSGWGPSWWGYGYNACGYPNGGGYPCGTGGGYYNSYGGPYTGAGPYDTYGGRYRGGGY
jgi:hypothetical protein